jgi:hypothetical protein
MEFETCGMPLATDEAHGPEPRSLGMALPTQGADKSNPVDRSVATAS